jgi:hypothetical protein
MKDKLDHLILMDQLIHKIESSIDSIVQPFLEENNSFKRDFFIRRGPPSRISFSLKHN